MAQIVEPPGDGIELLCFHCEINPGKHGIIQDGPPELPSTALRARYVGDCLLEHGGVGVDGLQRRVVAFGAGHREKLVRVAHVAVEPRQRIHQRFERLAFAADLLRALAVAPDRRIFGQLDDFG